MFKTRLISGIVMVVVLALLIYFGGPVLFAAFLIISIIGMMELFRAIGGEKEASGKMLKKYEEGDRGIQCRTPGIAAYIAIIIYNFLAYFEKLEYAPELYAGFFIVLMIIYVMTFPKYDSVQITMAFFGFFYVGVMLSYVYRITQLTGGSATIIMIFIGSWGSDTGAYVVGRLFGKHKLIPKLSPKKSVEGFFGGIVTSGLLGALFGGVLAKSYMGVLANPAIACAIIGAASSLISQIGDWTASAIKRNYGIKDYGRLFPGHGGIMDRFDSVIFTAPVVYYLAMLLQK